MLGGVGRKNCERKAKRKGKRKGRIARIRRDPKRKRRRAVLELCSPPLVSLAPGFRKGAEGMKERVGRTIKKKKKTRDLAEFGRIATREVADKRPLITSRVD